MEYRENIKNTIFSLKNIGRPVSITAGIIFISLVGILMYASYELSMHYFILGGLTAILLVPLIVIYPRLWLYILAILAAFFFINRAEGISAMDVITGAYFTGGIFIWLFWKIFIEHEKIILNLMDWFVMFFFIAAISNYLIAYLNDVEFLEWLREYTRISVILYYFPIRYYFKNKVDIRRLLLVFGITTLIADFDQFHSYYKALSDVTYAYQLSKSIRLNQSLFTATTVFGLAFALMSRKKLFQLALLAFSAISFTALITSFSRTFWLIAMINVLLLFIYVSWKQKKRLLYFILIIISAAAFTGLVAFRENSKILFKVIEKRFTSSAKGTQDKSFNARLHEWDNVMDKINEQPLSGHGMGKLTHYFHPLLHYSIYTPYVHNGYLMVSYKFGIPLALILFLPMLINLLKAESLARQAKDPFYKVLAICSGLALLLMLAADFTCAAYQDRDGLFVIMMSYALIGIVENKLKEASAETITAEKQLT